MIIFLLKSDSIPQGMLETAVSVHPKFFIEKARKVKNIKSFARLKI